MITITLKTNNAAFYDCGEYDPREEVARILETLAQRIREEGVEPYVRLMDYNGNAVGSLQTDEE